MLARSRGMLLSSFTAAMMAENLGLGSAFTSNGLLSLGDLTLHAWWISTVALDRWTDFTDCVFSTVATLWRISWIVAEVHRNWLSWHHQVFDKKTRLSRLPPFSWTSPTCFDGWWSIDSKRTWLYCSTPLQLVLEVTGSRGNDVLCHKALTAPWQHAETPGSR